jgi:PBSX family phage terminase large subunit
MWWRLPKYNKFKRVVYNGAVRTLKTDGGIRSFREWACDIVQNHPKQKGYANFLIIGTTRENIKENAVDVMLNDMEQDGFYRCEKFKDVKQGQYRFYVNETVGVVFVKYEEHLLTFRYMGADNVGAIRRIQGKTVHGAFIDEGALIPITILQTVEQRMLSFKDTYKVFITTNPEGGDEHEFYQNYIKGAYHKGTLVISYTLLDNPTFTQEDIDYYEKIYTRDMFLRKILGKWVRSIGAIYQKFTTDRHVIPVWDIAPYESYKYSKFYVGIDYGETAASVYTLIGMKKDYQGLDVLQEWYHKDSDYNQMDINDKLDAFFEWTGLIYRILKRPLIVQCESATHGKTFYKLALTRIRQKGISWLIMKTVNKTQQNPKELSAIEERISTLNIMLGANYVRIDPSCKYLISAIKNAVRDKKGQRLDTDAVNIDSLDSLEYAFIPEMRNIRRKIEYLR